MFTGIVQTVLRITGVGDGPMARRLTVAHGWEDLKLGESIAINGVCLTVAGLDPASISFDVIRETLDRTNLDALVANDLVNAERALRVGDRVDGHFVQGHVDGVGRLSKQISTESEWRLTIEAPRAIAKYLAPKGSICVDGVSLTIASIDGNHFDVALIPTTLDTTTIGRRQIGWQYNLEADIISKQIVNFMERRQG